jgi:hypothetical protein
MCSPVATITLLTCGLAATADVSFASKSPDSVLKMVPKVTYALPPSAAGGWGGTGPDR